MNERPPISSAPRSRRIARALLLWVPLFGALILALVTLSRGRGHRDERTDVAADGASASSAPERGRAIGSAPTDDSVAPPPSRPPTPSRDPSSVRSTTAAPTDPGSSIGGATPSAERAIAATGSAPAAATDDEAPRGTLPREVIQSTVREAMPFLRFCFEWQLDLHPELGGRVSMEWRIRQDGTVVDANIVEDGLEDETVLRCFRGVIGRLTFPPPEGGEVVVRYPFVLSNAPEARPPDGI
jgi:hypothetical protein